MKKICIIFSFLLAFVVFQASAISAAVAPSGGTAISSSNAPNTKPEYAFDGIFKKSSDDNAPFWQSAPNKSTKGNAYIGYDFGLDKEVTVSQITVQQHPTAGFSVSSVIVQKLINGQWEDVGTYDVKMYDTTIINLPQPITAQGWRLMANSNVLYEWAVIEVDLGIQDITTPIEPEQPSQPAGKHAFLVVTMTTGMVKEYDLPMSDVNAFLNWYDVRDTGIGPSKFAINKYSNNKGPFSKRTDYVIFDKILTFEVSEYTTN
ncbi:discoidin domain-containing protein [Paenibacillus sp. NPDC057886]|uniref:discoidin domain-containing protein n=1 Tax=Paenibacillus sp. NPDC057886 TaxID=3346270 RepID=UPI0036845DC8